MCFAGCWGAGKHAKVGRLNLGRQKSGLGDRTVV